MHHKKSHRIEKIDERKLCTHQGESMVYKTDISISESFIFFCSFINGIDLKKNYWLTIDFNITL